MTRAELFFGGAALGCMALALALAACAPRSDAAQAEKPKVRVVEGTDVSVYKDPETGCEYLKLYSSGITPRYDRSYKSYESMKVKGCH